MDLALNRDLARGYKSASQIARRVTEGWFEERMYCPACPSQRLHRTQDNTRVVDFVCPSCAAEYQLKAKSSALGRKVRDAAYAPMMRRAERNRSPHFAFLQYDRREWRVRRLLLVPGHFITPATIERCAPLSDSARRAGWVGCNILLENVGEDGRLLVVDDHGVQPPTAVRRKWARFSWLADFEDEKADVRGWTLDVLRCVRTFGGRAFNTRDIYEFEPELARLHPNNNTIPDQIRKQLQILRDRGIVRFLGKGRYVAE